jgi:hypothetical protein
LSEWWLPDTVITGILTEEEEEEVIRDMVTVT